MINSIENDLKNSFASCRQRFEDLKQANQGLDLNR